MASRTSLRKKFAYTFLAGAIVTVVLFSVAIKRIMSDYFARQSAARLTFVEEQGVQEVRANLAVFKNAHLQYFNGDLAGLFPIAESGVLLGDHLPRTDSERTKTAALLRGIQSQRQLSMITVVDLNGKVIVRATNPAVFGDDTLVRDYENSRLPVSSIKNLLKATIDGHTITAYEIFAPEILAKENAIADGKTISSLADNVKIPLKSMSTRSRDGTLREVKVPPGQFEERSLMMTVAQPVRNSRGAIVGAIIAGRSLNKNQTFLDDAQAGTSERDQATIWLGNGPSVRIATTRKITEGENKGQDATGTIRPARPGNGPGGGAGNADGENKGQDAASRTPRTGNGREGSGGGGGGGRGGNQDIDGEPFKTATTPLKDYDNNTIGSMTLARPLSLLDSIANAQEEIALSVNRRTTFYIVGLGILTIGIAILIATIFSSRITRRIDQLRKGAETISDGNLDYRLQIQSGDEIELLAEQFNSMAAKLHDSYQTLENKVEERTRELKASQETMVQQEKMVGIGQLAAGIAHELNTPLGTIIGYAQMLKEDLASQPSSNGSQADVDEIVEQAGRCRDLVKNLLNFSRRSTTEKAQASINSIVRKIVSLVEHDFEMKRVRVQLALDSNLPTATLNENEIAQVVLNLANNAVDSMPEGGDLRIRTFYDGESDRIGLEVHDNGLGISESDRKRVFEPFFTTKEVGKGTGLGLSICYKIIENHMGSMEFDSVIGQGTTFRVYLPVNAEVRVV